MKLRNTVTLRRSHKAVTLLREDEEKEIGLKRGQIVTSSPP
jgi:hypothetical protein